MNIHDDKQRNHILRLLNLVDSFHTELDKKLILAVNNILQEILRNPQTTYSVNDIEKIIKAVEYSIKRTTSQNYQQFPELLQQNSILKGKLTAEIEVDVNALQEALINTKQLLDQRELEISRLSTTVEGLNERLYEALEELNEEQKYMQALEQEITALKTQLSQILSESGQIQESTLQSLLATLEATDSQEIRNKSKLERIIKDKEQLASDVKSLDRALQNLKIQYYQALEKIDAQNQEIEEVLQENSRFRDMITEWGKEELPTTPLADSREPPLVSTEISSSNVSAMQRTRSVTETVIKTRDDNILSLANRLEARLEDALSSFKDLEDDQPVIAEPVEDDIVESSSEIPTEVSMDFIEVPPHEETPSESDTSIQPDIPTEMSADEITEEEELPDIEVSAEEDQISHEEPVSEPEEELTPSSTPRSLTRDGVVGSLDELFDVAPEEPKSDTAGVIERRFEELMTTDSPISALEQADSYEEMKTDTIVGELEALADEKETGTSEDETVEIPDTFSEVYKELDSTDDDKDSLFDWDPMKLFTEDTDAYTSKEMAIKRSLISSQTPFIIEKGQTQIVGINKKRAKALRKHFGVKNLEDLLSLDSKVVAKKLGRKVKPEMVDDWKSQVHLFL